MDNLIYILNIDGRDLVAKSNYNNETKKNTCTIKNDYGFNTTYIDSETGQVMNKKFNNWYTCSLPISMDLLELENYAPDEFLTYDKKGRNSKPYTKALVNVTFDKSVALEGQEGWKTKKIRTELYKKGFTIDGVEYVEFKRSSSKAREGSTLFIKQSLYDHMIEWSRLGLEFKPEEKVDIASLRAYESLTLSGLDISDGMKNLVEIKPNQILIINSYDSIFTDKASVTELIKVTWSSKIVTPRYKIPHPAQRAA